MRPSLICTTADSIQFRLRRNLRGLTRICLKGRFLTRFYLNEHPLIGYIAEQFSWRLTSQYAY